MRAATVRVGRCRPQETYAGRSALATFKRRVSVNEDLRAPRHARVHNRAERGGEIRRGRAQRAAGGLGELLLGERDLVSLVRSGPLDAGRLVRARDRTSREGDSHRQEDRLSLALAAYLHREATTVADGDVVRQVLDLDALDRYAHDIRLAFREGLRGQRLGRRAGLDWVGLDLGAEFRRLARQLLRS